MKRPSDRTLGFLATGVLALVLVWVVFFGGTGASPSRAPVNGLGVGVAREVVRQLDGAGEVVILADQLDAYLEAVVDGMRTVLDDDGSGISIRAVEELGGTFVDWPEVEPLPSEVYLEVMSRHRDADLVLTFIGLPLLSESDRQVLGTSLPRILGVYEAEELPPAARLAMSGLDAAVVPKASRAPVTSDWPATPDQWFERDYVVLRVRNL